MKIAARKTRCGVVRLQKASYDTLREVFLKGEYEMNDCDGGVWTFGLLDGKECARGHVAKGEEEIVDDHVLIAMASENATCNEALST